MEQLKQQIQNYQPYNEQEIKDKEVMLKYLATFDNLLTRKNEFAHFTASAWVVNKERTKVLMIYHNIYQSWAWTGGHADGEENLQKVALREVEEETGLQNLELMDDAIYSLEILTVNGHVKRGKYVSSHLHLNLTFLMEADEQEATKIKQDENSGVKWVSIEEATKVTNEVQMMPIYKKLNQKLVEI